MLISLSQLVSVPHLPQGKFLDLFVCFPEVRDLKMETLSIKLWSWSYHSLVNFRLKADRNF